MPRSHRHGQKHLNSHFYTASAAECEGLKQPSSGWAYEGIAFQALTPNQASCPTDSAPVWRRFDDRAETGGSNHRFVASNDACRSMMAAGWIGEGVAFCSPN